MVSQTIKNQSGFIALISVIIITAILLVIITTASMSGFFSRFNTADSEFKAQSSALAEACVQKALLKLIVNESYAGNESIPIANTTCFIRAVVSNGNEKTIETQGVAGTAYTNLRVIIDRAALSIISREEVAHW